MDLARAKLPELSGENIQALASHLQAFCLNLGSMGKPWSCRATFSMLPPSIAEKLSKKTEKSRLWDAFGPALASFWLHFACPAVAWQSLFRLFVETRATLTEKLDLAISMPLSSGIAVCAGPGVQVGATWAKSPVRSPKSGLEVPSQSGQDSQVGRSVRGALSKLWKPPRRSPDLSRVGGQSLSKRQVI